MRPATAKAAALSKLVIPAALIGVVSALALVALTVLSNRLQRLLWDTLPDALDISSESAAWIVIVLTLTGFLVGMIVWLVPGHGGPDPATESLVSAPLPLWALPGLAAVVIVGLGGGVSLGPENPIVAINVALAVWFGNRVARGAPVPVWVGMAAGGTVGAMFGTPVGAVLALSETPAAPDGPSMWDRLFAPLVAATVGALTMDALDQPIMSVDVAPYPGMNWPDLIKAPAVALCAALVGLVLIYAFPFVHSAFIRIRNPVAMLTLGGLILGALGAIGGTITLFKGLAEMKQLVGEGESARELIVIVMVKTAALLVAACAGFRGGRIFPSVFIGVALGMLANELVPSIGISLAIGAAILGILLVVTRSGWLSLFVAVTILGQTDLLPVLCIAFVPVWLLVTDRPELIIKPKTVPAT